MLDRLGGVYWRLGRAAEAVEHMEAALALYRGMRDRVGEGRALDHLGIQRMHLGDYQGALDACHQARDIATEDADPYGLAHVTHNIGAAYDCLGRAKP
ncbi:MAG: tetratricopeptide repeat protein [Thermocrispum sp.]